MNMNALQVSIVCLLLRVTFDPVTAQLLSKIRCRGCPSGYFVVKNCTETMVNNKPTFVGVACRRCTDCSAAGEETLTECSTFADSQCGSRNTLAATPASTPTATPAATPAATPTKLPVSAPELWIIYTVIVFSSVIFLLSTLFLILLFYRNRQQNKIKDLDPL